MSPFDDADGAFLALVNGEGRYSLWPEVVPVPSGWTVVHGADTREGCLSYIEQNWTDLRPAS